MYSNHENFLFSSTIQNIRTKNKIAENKEINIHEGVPLILLTIKKIFRSNPIENIIILIPQSKI
tara:strand:- start:162 stop:353 length:192 start_codon:yes stop_codon:yes gene_type:complete